jgi:hypothetical protein
MAKCSKCGKWGLFLKLDNGLCADCACISEQENDNLIWMKISDEESAYKFSTHLWEKLRKTETETRTAYYLEKDELFWADEIKKYRDIPNKRLDYALKNLPYPAAFREAMIALRVITKNKIKTNADINDEEYKFLYRIGVVNSMCIPYSYTLEQPGFNVMERIPGALLFSLPIPYKEIGYEKIPLFNKTDCKMFIKLWGIPETHFSMNEYYNSIWKKYEKILVEDQKKQ